jgi:hypothetical protein
LHVTEYDGAGLAAGPGLDLAGQAVADPAEPDVAELVAPGCALLPLMPR